MGIDKYYRKGVFPSLKVGGVDVLGALGLPAIQGTVYYVEGNAGNDNNDGLSWDKAFKTLATALAASHANIAANSRGWAARNTIYIKGDTLDEDLTKLAQKTDIIGVGSCDDQPRARITGTHIIPDGDTVSYMGCRFFNVEFVDDGATSNITMTNQPGIEFHNCRFTCQAAGTLAITATSCHRLVINQCEFLPMTDGTYFATAAIKIAGTTIYGLQIKDSFIVGAIGIDCDSTNVFSNLIKGNIIIATTLGIDDESDDLVIVDNKIISAADQATLGNVLDYNAALGANNIVTGSTGTVAAPACNFGAQS